MSKQKICLDVETPFLDAGTPMIVYRLFTHIWKSTSMSKRHKMSRRNSKCLDEDFVFGIRPVRKSVSGIRPVRQQHRDQAQEIQTRMEGHSVA